MYESFFQFHTRPFPCTPRTDLYFPAASIEHAHYTLARLIERAEGPGLLIGGPGTGKTLVCQMLEDRFRQSFHIVMLNSAQLTTQRALLQHILFELELAYRGLDEGELLLSLMEFLQPGKSPKAGLLLLVDEAHTLPAPVLEGLRTITNVTRNGQPRVRLVLAGGPQLEERFAHPELDCFNQRLAARCYLQPLNYDETCAYVRSQIAKAGAPPDRVIAHDAWQPIYHATDGIPRLINQICDHALMLACMTQRGQLDGRMIDDAWADLQQLPTPWEPTGGESPAATGVIEFGGLAA
jgi:type II secretory pathway predicted ATPase ExeA